MHTDCENINHSTAQGITPMSRFAYAACATPPGTSGIAVIRMSGDDSFKIASEIFYSKALKPIPIFDMDGYTCAYGEIRDYKTKQTIDDVILTKFVSPNSYTGEDTIEISCHGGVAVKNAILDNLYLLGARPAQPGEFTRNAFINGKIDLAQAEAVMDLISATARKASDEAAKHLHGDLSDKIRGISSEVYTLMSHVEMIVEFPEHEETDEAIFSINNQINNISQALSLLLNSFNKGRILNEGMTVVIAGKPNAGKSSMLNTLAGYDRAIVTSIAGTTRDTIEETIDVEGIPVRLIDTAGLRKSNDEVEIIGINRARKAIKDADVVFWISSELDDDMNDIMDSDDDLNEIIKSHKENSLVIIIGKSDKNPFEKNAEMLRSRFNKSPIIPFSSLTREGLQEVRQIIKKKYEETGAIGSSEVLITSARHYYAIKKASDALNFAREGMSNNLPLDLLASVLRNVAEALALVTGDEVTEELVNEIFSRFCIGK